MPVNLSRLQFKIAAAVLAALILLAALNEFLRTAPFGIRATLINLSATLIVFILIFWYTHRQAQSLEKLAETVSQIASGELTARADQNLKNEVGPLAEAVNRMADQLVKKIDLLERDNLIKKEFISIMAHNLQTPLTIVRGYVDQLLEERKELSSVQVKTLEIIENTVKNLGEMNDRLLTTIELQGEAIKLNKVKKDLGHLVGVAVREFKKRAEEKQIVLNLEVAREPLTAEFDEEWLEVVFKNLLDNALKFTPEKGKVTVRVGKTAQGLIFGEVEDTGIGIPQDEQNKVMLPFRRARDVQRAGFEGVGVGLYIVKTVIEKHGGQLLMESREGRGTKIRFVLPKPKDQ